jgi:hypothetical protein
MDKNDKGLFLMSKQREMNEFCVEKCLGSNLGQALSIREENCLSTYRLSLRLLHIQSSQRIFAHVRRH